jgi:hypothetical protein
MYLVMRISRGEEPVNVTVTADTRDDDPIYSEMVTTIQKTIMKLAKRKGWRVC